MPVPYFFQQPIRLGQIVEEYFDLSAIPKKYIFSILSHFSEDPLEKGKCAEFCTPEGQEDLFNYCNRPRRTVLEVLKDFPHSTSKLTLQSLFELFTCIKPRSFSIASSCKVAESSKVEILVAVVKYYTKLKAPRLGLCSNWLKSLDVSDKIFGWYTKGTFFFPKDENTPVVMIGPGTGLAPFRSYIMEREHSATASKDKLMLIFGCRFQSKDFHCKELLRRLEAEDKLMLVCAFSRDQEDKIYVQHKIKDFKESLWTWISQRNAMIFVAGNSKNMPDNVKDSLIENVFMDEGKMDKEKAKTFLKQMEDSRKLQLETW